MNLFKGFLLGMVFFGVSGCVSEPSIPTGNARYVMVDNKGGVVALPRRERDRRQAVYLMRKKCHRGFDIVREAEVETGEVQRTENKASNDNNTATGNSVIIREKKYEYHIYFECK